MEKWKDGATRENPENLKKVLIIIPLFHYSIIPLFQRQIDHGPTFIDDSRAA
jgi:hypothetical protein